MTRRSRLFDKVSKHFFWWPGRELEPASIDGVSYGLAALLYRGRPLIAVAQTAAGCSSTRSAPPSSRRSLRCWTSPSTG